MKRKIEITTVEHIRILTGRCPHCGWVPGWTVEPTCDDKVPLELTAECVDIGQLKENSNPKGGITK